MLAWALKGAENSGHDAADVIASAPRVPDAVSAIFAGAGAMGAHQQAPALPPWISAPTAPMDCSDADSQIIDYLNVAADEISKRVNALTVDAAQTRPAWMNALGAVSGGHARYQEWLHHVGVVAAYRDQYQVSSDDPRQVLGPCAEPGHAGHGAYWRAAESVLAARAIAGLERRGAGGTDVGAQVAADLYLGLPADERAAVGAVMAERLGVLWFGTPAETDDHAATRPMYAPQLAAVLIEHGYLTYKMAALESRATGSASTIAVADEPVEAAFARRRAARAALGSTRDSARHRNVQSSQNRRKPARAAQTVRSGRKTVAPAEQGDDPVLPRHARPVNQHRDPGPVQ